LQTLPKPSYLKIVVTGPFGSGKTTFIKTVCGDILGTDRNVTSPYEKMVKRKTTVAFDYGKVYVKNIPIHLFGTPGQTRFQFMIKVLTVGMHGYIFIIDGSSIKEVLRGKILYDNMLSYSRYPHIIAINKQDIRGSLSLSEVSKIMNISKDRLYPLIALDKNSALRILNVTVDKILTHRLLIQKKLRNIRYKI